MENNNETLTVYTQEENANLSKMKDVRMAIIENMTKDGMPVKTSELRVLNEIISAQEASIHTTVGNRIKFNSNQQNGQVKEMVVEVLKQTAIAVANANKVPDLEIGNALEEDDMVYGETEITPEELNVKDFMMDAEEISYESESDDEKE